MIDLMAVAHLIHGWIGAGKTTFARRLEEDVRGIRLSIDEWYLGLFTDGSPTDVLDVTLESRLISRLDSFWPQILGGGIDVVLDFGFWQRAPRDRARDLARSVGADTKLYWVQCDEATALERVRRRHENPEDNWRRTDDASTS